ncbi:anion permease, partial [Staphylococcus saprophyticus]|nr:anion permease [Staphylococcus saprophyticus]
MDTEDSRFVNSSNWIKAMSIFITRGLEKTGKGRRNDLQIVKLFGKKTLGVAYSFIGVQLIFAPDNPSNTSRAGRIMFPI